MKAFVELDFLCTASIEIVLAVCKVVSLHRTRESLRGVCKSMISRMYVRVAEEQEIKNGASFLVVSRYKKKPFLLFLSIGMYVFDA